MKIWFDMVTERDGKKLCKWWNAHTIDGHFTLQRSPSNRRYWAVMREPAKDWFARVTS